MLVILMATAVPVAMILLRYVPYLLIREPRWRTADVQRTGSNIVDGLVRGIDQHHSL